MNSVELREQRAKIAKDAREVMDRANSEARDMNSEEKAQFDKMIADVDKLKSQIESLEKVEAVEDEISVDSEAARKRNVMGIETRDARGSKDGLTAYRNYCRNGETRDLVLSTNTAGGYVVTPVEVSEQIITLMNNAVFMRQLATVHTLNSAASLGAPRLTTDMTDPAWTSEVSAVSADTAMVYDRRDITPKLLAKLVTVSHQLLNARPNVEAHVNERLVYKYGIAQENGYLNGDGSGKPLGVFQPSSSGISTARDVVGSNTTTAITADTLFDVKYFLKSGYLKSKSVAWILNRTVIKDIAKLKDSENRYLWQPALSAGTPDTLLDIAVYSSEYAPNTMTAGLYVGILGDFSYYWIADQKALEIQRLVERYAEKNEVGFIGRFYSDGAPILEEAFSRIKLAAS